MSWIISTLKAFTAMRHSTNAWLTGPHAGHRSRYDYARDVGIGLDASVVMAPVQWIQRTLPTAPLVVESREQQGEIIPDHPLAMLLAHPNPGYSSEHLLAATVFSLCISGNAYWIKVRNGAGRVAELWYAPHWLVEPKWPVDGSAFISHYDYRPGGELMRLDPADVVHFRHGIDPHNLRLGLAPLASVLREVWADMEAAVFVAAVLRNSGVPGLVVSPDGPTSASADDVAAIKRYLADQFSGEHRGAPLVFSAKTKVDRIGWSPEELDLSTVSNRAEERVCALLGVPPVVVGLHAGTTQTSVGATMHEQVRIAWQSGVIPMQSLIAAEVARSLLPDMDRRPERLRVYFDISAVEALQEETDKTSLRAERLARAGIITLAEARQMMGIDSDDRHELFLRPMGVVEVPGSTNRATAAEQASPPPEAPKARFKHGHSPFDVRIAQTAPHVEPSESAERFADALEARRRRDSAKWSRTLAGFFRELGSAATDLEQIIEDGTAKGATAITKDLALLDHMLTDRVLEALDLPGKTAIFREHYERHYLAVAESVPKIAAAAGIIGLATDLPDRVARAVIATGGRRAGLIDLRAQARAAVMTTLAESRAEGLGVAAMVRRLVDDRLPAGPWSSPAVRAEVIARTETKYAQNYSVIEHAIANEVQRFVVFDARLGETDEICMALDGAIVTAVEAAELLQTEHPNGTRAFVPYYGD